MQSLFRSDVVDEIIYRLRKLQPETKPLWGKMNVSAMMAHCRAPLQVALGDLQLKRTLIGVLFGKWGKKQLLKEEPFKKNLPTDPHFVIKEDKDFHTEQQQLQSLIERFATTDPTAVAAKSHPFFGRMTPDEWGKLQWKHLDHHLKQFGV